MVDLEQGSRHAASSGNAPDQSVELDVQSARGAAAIVNIAGAETNDGTEGLFPGEMRKVDGNIWIGGEDGTSGAGSGLVLIDLERAGEARAVLAEMPAGGITVGGTSERAATEHQEIAAAMEKIGDSREGGFRDNRTLRKDEELRVGVAERGSEFVGGQQACAIENLRELAGSSGGGIGRGETGFGPDHHAGEFLAMEESGNKKRECESKHKSLPGGTIHVDAHNYAKNEVTAQPYTIFCFEGL